MLEKLAVSIPLPGQQKSLVSNWYLPPETSNFLQWVCFSESKFQTELQQYQIICADLNAHDPLWDPIARPLERREFLGEMKLDADGAFLNTDAPTRQDPSTGSFSTQDITIVYESLQELFDWLPCDSLSSDH